MPPVPRLTARELIAALQGAGWYEVRGRGKGSHVQLTHPEHGRKLTIPYHKGRTLPVGIVRGIIADAGLTVDEFWRLL